MPAPGRLATTRRPHRAPRLGLPLHSPSRGRTHRHAPADGVRPSRRTRRTASSRTVSELTSSPITLRTASSRRSAGMRVSRRALRSKRWNAAAVAASSSVLVRSKCDKGRRGRGKAGVREGGGEGRRGRGKAGAREGGGKGSGAQRKRGGKEEDKEVSRRAAMRPHRRR